MQLLYNNIVRVMREVEQVSANMVNAQRFESVIYPNATLFERTCRLPRDDESDEEDDDENMHIGCE